jgi:ABC-type glycerol-3-phosphate transport system permease component
MTLPLSWSIVSSMAVLVFTGVWGEWLWMLLVLQRDELRPVSVGLLLLATSGSPQTPHIGIQMAGSVLAAIPLILLFALAMRTFVEGLTAGAIKM